MKSRVGLLFSRAVGGKIISLLFQRGLGGIKRRRVNLRVLSKSGENVSSVLRTHFNKS